METNTSKLEKARVRQETSLNPFMTPTVEPAGARKKEAPAKPGRKQRMKPKRGAVSNDTEDSILDEETEAQITDESSSVIDSILDGILPMPAPVLGEWHNPISESRSPDGLPSYRCEFEGRDIFVGWPWYKTANPVTAAINVALALDFGRDKIRFDMSIGNALIHDARNKLVQKFLETEARWLFMMDDDILPSIGRPAWFRHWIQGARHILDAPLQRHILHRLMGANKTLIGGAYFGRQEGSALMCSDQSLAADAKVYADRVVPLEWVATGCMLIHRNVFRDIMAKSPEIAPVEAGEPWDFFRLEGGRTGEDVSFCRRAKKAGHQCHIDLGVPVFHLGYKTY